MTKYELRYHSAMPGWVKVVGLRIRKIPACEGGGYAIPEEAGKRLVAQPEPYNVDGTALDPTT